ncbi:MAG: ribonuclease III domain-containing protein [Oscillospiraceae bacterium]
MTDLITKAKQYSPLGLAYIGDSIYEIMVRQKVIARGNMPVQKLHTKTIEYVCAKAQSQAIEIILPILNEDEIAIYKRGRNANANHTPKNGNPQEYRRATGLEALFGYLYLSEQTTRISELFELIYTGKKQDN